jgi:sphinganine C4-monooxygenase
MSTLLLCFIPFVTYWTACGLFELIFPSNPQDKNVTNTVSPKKVFINVLGVTMFATLGNFALYYFHLLDYEKFRFLYVILGIWWIDTVEYFVHLTMHRIPYLYRLAHKEHHRLNVPYHYGAFYNSSYEANITGSILTIGFILLGFSFYEFILVTSLANIATVIDHVDFRSYSDSKISKFLSKNNFHYIHHSTHQNCNFQQPFFTYYDRIFGTYKV